MLYIFRTLWCFPCQVHASFLIFRFLSQVSSTLSGVNEIHPKPEPAVSPQKGKEFSTIIQRKCKRTEQSRKMAEARRQFLHKFGNHLPDRQKLTMIDLIFYNPVSNPMRYVHNFGDKLSNPLGAISSKKRVPERCIFGYYFSVGCEIAQGR